MPECTCYPYGCTPETYEGPMRHCPVHGECLCTPDDIPIGEIDGPDEVCPVHGEETDDFQGSHGDDIDNGLEVEQTLRNILHDLQDAYEKLHQEQYQAREWVIPPSPGEPEDFVSWCQIGPGKWIGPVGTPRPERAQEAVMGPFPNVTDWPLNVTNRIANDLGGSKVGEESARLVPTDSAPGQEGCNQSLTRALERAWKRTFGPKTRVGIQDLKIFPHLTGSHWFPLVPGTSAGQEEMSPPTGSRSYRGNQSGTHSPGVGGSGVRQHQDREPVARWLWRHHV